jgi:hypothetical protein
MPDGSREILSRTHGFCLSVPADWTDAIRHVLPGEVVRAGRQSWLGPMSPLCAVATWPVDTPLDKVVAVRAESLVSAGWRELGRALETVARRDAVRLDICATRSDGVEWFVRDYLLIVADEALLLRLGTFDPEADGAVLDGVVRSFALVTKGAESRRTSRPATAWSRRPSSWA